jgi:rod shape-determining protein MreB
VIDTILGWFSKDMGIDLGTCNTLVCARHEGIVLNEPSVVAVRKGTNIVLNNGEAVGLSPKHARQNPRSSRDFRSLKDGVITILRSPKKCQLFIRKFTAASFFNRRSDRGSHGITA